MSLSKSLSWIRIGKIFPAAKSISIILLSKCYCPLLLRLSQMKFNWDPQNWDISSQPVLGIWDCLSRILILINPGSRIQQRGNKRRGKPFFVATTFTKWKIFYFWTLTVTDIESRGYLNPDMHCPASLNRNLHEKLSDPATQWSDLLELAIYFH